MINKYEQESDNAVYQPRSIYERLRWTIRNNIISSMSMLTPPSNGNFLRCLYCHYVFDDQRKQFAELIAQLKNSADFINTDSLISIAKGNAPLNGKYYHLSFDDGFKNIVQNAVPILLDNNVPSIFFVPTNYIGADFNEAKTFCLQKTSYGSVIEMASSSDLQEMANAGFDIGAHTRTHPKLARISKIDALKKEIMGPKIDLELKHNIQCKYFSWPFGRRSDVNKKVIAIINNSGYKASFGAFRGSIIPGKTDYYMIPRHHFEVHWPLSHILFFAGV
jgi:hypothetical protein